MKTKNITITTATIDFGDWTLTATGHIGDVWDWSITDYSRTLNYSKSWKSTEFFTDKQELEEWMWQTVLRIYQKYSHCEFEDTSEEVEDFE